MSKEQHMVTIPRTELEELERKAEEHDDTVLNLFKRSSMEGFASRFEEFTVRNANLIVDNVEAVTINGKKFFSEPAWVVLQRGPIRSPFNR